MATIKERITCIETELKYIKRMVNATLVIVLGQAGIKFVPFLFSVLLQS